MFALRLGAFLGHRLHLQILWLVENLILRVYLQISMTVSTSDIETVNGTAVPIAISLDTHSNPSTHGVYTRSKLPWLT